MTYYEYNTDMRVYKLTDNISDLKEIQRYVDGQIVVDVFPDNVIYRFPNGGIGRVNDYVLLYGFDVYTVVGRIPKFIQKMTPTKIVGDNE